MPRKPSTHRIDRNHHEIADVAKRYGWDVWHTHSIGGGGPDFVAFHPYHRFRLIEVKAGKKANFTSAQASFHRQHAMPITVVSSVEEAEVVFGPNAAR